MLTTANLVIMLLISLHKTTHVCQRAQIISTTMLENVQAANYLVSNVCRKQHVSLALVYLLIIIAVQLAVLPLPTATQPP
jgi:hypothetical protein